MTSMEWIYYHRWNMLQNPHENRIPWWESFWEEVVMWREQLQIGKKYLETESCQGFRPIDLISGLSDKVIVQHIWPKVLATFEESPDDTFEVVQGKSTTMLSILFINKKFCFLTRRMRPYAPFLLTSFQKKDSVKSSDCTNNHCSLVITNCVFCKEEF